MGKFFCCKLLLSGIICMAFCGTSNAAVLDVDTALFNVRVACDNISGELDDIKKKAGIGAVVSGVGVGAGAGAAIAGFMKASKDKQLEKINMLKAALENRRNEILGNKGGAWPYQLQSFREEFIKQYSTDIMTKLTGEESGYQNLEKQSKNLGNVRTGLLAGATVTNVAGAVISGGNKVGLDLHTMVNDCIKAVGDLRDSRMQAMVSRDDSSARISEMDAIISACGEYETVDLSKIDNRAKGAMISSIVGAGLGLGGTVTSAAANTDAVRNARNADGSDAKSTKNLNTASNVLAIGTAGASGVATVFNATQISVVKRIVAVADKCEDALR